MSDDVSLEIYNIKEHYDKFWHKWDFKNSNRFKNFPLLIDMIGKIKPNSIMEIGCGGGANLKLIQKFYPDIKLNGIDISDTAIEITKKNVDGDFFVSDARFLKTSYDLVLTVHSLEQMKYILKDVIFNISKITDKILLFEPFFCLQNIFGKWHCIRSEYVQGIPFYVRDSGFDILEFKKTNRGNFLSKTGMLYGVKK